MSENKSPRGPNARRLSIAAVVSGVVAAVLLVVLAMTGNPASSAGPPATGGPSRGGTGWQETPVPVEKGDVTAVAAVSDKEAWAVGYRLASDTELEAVALRWDGTSWTQQSTLPNDSFPQAIAARSADDVWAAGAATYHWDGKSWTTRDLARDPDGRMVTESVAAASGSRAWVVGRAVKGSIKEGIPAIQSWNGSSWRKDELPDFGAGELNSVAAVGPDDAWAAGTVYASGDDAQQTTLLLHWDGTSWKRVDSPNRGEETTWIGGLTALGANDVWAVGGSTADGGSDQPFAMRWDGKKWSATPTPDVTDGRLRTVARDGDGTLWAIGGKDAVSVALRWDDTSGRWVKAADPDLVVRSSATVPDSSSLWTVGIAKKGDLVPEITRYAG